MLDKLVKSLVSYCNKDLVFQKPPRLFLKQDKANSTNPLGKTAHYQPNERIVTVYVSGRHPKDILRSIAHELVHHHQNERGDLDGCGPTEEGYAQSDEHLRNMEKEAYLKGNMLFRDWEDSCKKQMQMEDKNKMKLSELKKIIKETIKEILIEKINTKQTETTLDEAGCDSHGKREDKESKKEKKKTDEGKAHKECKNGCQCEPIKEGDEALEEDWGGSSRPSDRGGYGYQSYDPASQSGAKERCRERARGKSGPDYWRTYNDCMSRSTYSNFEESNEPTENEALEEGENIQEMRDFWSEAQDHAEKQCGRLSGDAYSRCFRKEADEHYSYLIRQSQSSGGSSRYGSNRDHLISFYEESKVMTPEKEKALKENYMGEKRNRLFEKLTKKWTK